jgi:hypothetical protein
VRSAAPQDCAVLLAYVDESYDEENYFIAAAIGDELQWEAFRRELEVIRLRTASLHHLPHGFEFHAYELMAGAGDWAQLRGKHREAVGIFRAVLLAAGHARIRFIFRGLHLPGVAARRGRVIDPHGEALMHLLARIDTYATTMRGSEEVRIVADEIAIHAELQAQFRGYQELGTGGSRTRRLDMIGSPIVFSSSRAEAGLQLVDFAVYLHRRRESKVEQHPEARAAMHRLSRQLDPLTHHRGIWPSRTRAPH